MSPSHVATLFALSTVVAALGRSKSKDCKAILKSLEADHAAVMLQILGEKDVEGLDSDLDAFDAMRCMLAMGITRADVIDGAEPCIVGGRYAVRTADGLKLGPKVS